MYGALACVLLLVASTFSAPQTSGCSWCSGSSGSGAGASGSGTVNANVNVGGLTSGASGAVSGASGAAGNLVSGASGAAGSLVNSASGTAGGLVNSASGTAGGLVNTATGLLGSGTGLLGGATSGLLGGGSGLLGGLTGGNLLGLPLVGNVLGGGTSASASGSASGSSGQQCVQPGVQQYLAQGSCTQQGLLNACASAYSVPVSQLSVSVQANVNLGSVLNLGSTASQSSPICVSCACNLDASNHLCATVGGACHLVTSGLPIGQITNLLSSTLNQLLTANVQVNALGSAPLVLVVIQNLNIFLAVCLHL